MNVDRIIHNLEKEIKTAKVDAGVTARLERLKAIAAKYAGEDKVVPFEDIAKRIKAEKDELRMFTGWKKFDEIITGFRLGQLVVVSAATKSGKTTWLMDMTTRLKEYNPLWFPFEESAEELIRKFLERNEPPPHGYTPSRTPHNALQTIEERIIESSIKWGSKVVVIDHLGFIITAGADNHALRVEQTMRELKGLAKKWNVVIFLICHLTKTKMDTEPTLEDLRGSSSIAQEADTVILLWREMKRERGKVTITNNTNVSIQANRRAGSTGNVKMVFDKGHYLEQDWASVHEDAADLEFDKNW